MSKLRGSLSYANVVSSLALFLAVSGGTAVAAATIDSNDLERHAVTRSKIARGAVSKAKIPAGAVGASEIRNNSITGEQVRNGTLEAADFAEGQLPQGPEGPQGPPGPAGGTAIGGVVAPGGNLVYGNGIAAVTTGGSPGVYTVVFERNVNQCPAMATIGGFDVGDNTANGANGGTVSLQPGGDDSPTSVNQITFVTRALDGTNTPLPFHFAVFCS